MSGLEENIVKTFLLSKQTYDPMQPFSSGSVHSISHHREGEPVVAKLPWKWCHQQYSPTIKFWVPIKSNDNSINVWGSMGPRWPETRK